MVGTGRLVESSAVKRLRCVTAPVVAPCPCPRRRDPFVIRLRPRVGLSRTLSISVLVAGLAGGVLISDRQTQHRSTANVSAAHAAGEPVQGVENQPLDRQS